MDTKTIIVDRREASSMDLHEAVKALSDGALVAFPTETVYGLAVRADDPLAVARLRELKGRDSAKAFTLHIPNRDDVRQYIGSLNGVGARFIQKAWPGPLTVIFPVPDPLRVQAMSGAAKSTIDALYYDQTLGVRCPDDRIAQLLLSSVPAPVIATSANLAGKTPPTDGSRVLKDMNGHVDFVIDGGQTKYARPSTILRLTNGGYSLIRDGVYDASMLERLSMLRILFVCTGNTCRSPMAQEMARKMVADRIGCSTDDLPARGILVNSAGTSGGFGGAAEHAVEVMARRGLSLADHFSTNLTVEMIQQADYIFTMTRSQRDAVLQSVPSAQNRVHTLFVDEDVRDPVGGTLDEYEHCADIIAQGLQWRLKEVTL
ncbi:MAG: threonylcarbamoyl-AMP synthase [Planctomycetes bacterium]|nr:threonylcarbamoyl-AMP synthase [Planctomycetota bacterium]MBI3834727.1 threonylcarbamoyl-AMP synthase [Planctomycetota bacterium]